MATTDFITLGSALDIIDRLDRSGDKMTLACVVNGQTKTMEGTFTAEEARVAVKTLVDMGAQVKDIRRFEGSLGIV